MMQIEAGVRVSWRVPGLVSVVLALALAGCEDEHRTICHDFDGDGYGSVCRGGPDCDDSDPSVHQVLLGYPDGDGDGVTRALAASLCTDGELPDGYAPTATGNDCDDADPARSDDLVGYTDADGDGRGVGDAVLVCSGRQLAEGFAPVGGDCDDSDPLTFQTLRGFADGDGDGVGAGSRHTLCTAENLPPGYSEQSGDCDDSDASRYREEVVYTDADGSGVGAGSGQLLCMGELVPEGFAATNGDCDDSRVELYQELTGYRDVDGDGVGTGDAVTLCSGDFLPEGYTSAGGDCDDNQPAAYQELTGFFDDDGDGVGAGDAQSFCTGETLPEGVAAAGGDCDDRSAARYQLLGGHIDADGDGLGAGASQLVCSGDDLPQGYAAGDGDCDDTDANRYHVLEGYADADGDGVGVGASQSLCTGASLPGGFAEVTGDCDDRDDDAFALVSGYADADGDGFGLGALQALCTDGSLPGDFAEVDGDCNDRDDDVYQLLSGYQDRDGDGYGLGRLIELCSGDELRDGYSSLVGDCDDRDDDVFELVTGFADNDEDGVGAGDLVDVCSDGALPTGFAEVAGDCDDGDETLFLALHGYNDLDADGVGGGDAVTVCTDGALPAGMRDSGGDCDDEDFDNDESCHTCADLDGDGFFNGCDRFVVRSGPDCDRINGDAWRVVEVFRDGDGDGATVGEAYTMCVGEDVPERFVEEASAEEDCNDYDDTIFLATDVFQDADGDTYTDGPAATMCLGLEVPDFFTATSAGEDCDDYDPDVFQLLAGFPDTDEDTFTLEASVQVCAGDVLPAGYLGAASGELDCDDLDPFVNPGATEDPPGDLTDHDCDGVFPMPVTGDGVFVDGGFLNGRGDVGGAGNGGGPVCPPGADDLGGIDNPLSSIEAGIELAEECDLPAVFIAASGNQGGYEEGPLETTVSLYGGFRDNFTTQDLALPTSIVALIEEPGEAALTVPGGVEVSIAALTFLTFFEPLGVPTSARASTPEDAIVVIHNSGHLVLRHTTILFAFDIFELPPSFFGLLNASTGTLFAADNSVDMAAQVFFGSPEVSGDANGTEGHSAATALWNVGTLTAVRNVLQGGYSFHDEPVFDSLFFGGLGVDNWGFAVLRGNEVHRGVNCCLTEFCEDEGDPELMFAAAVHNGEDADAWLDGNVVSGTPTFDVECEVAESTIGGVANRGSAWIRDNEIDGGTGDGEIGQALGVYNLGSAVITGNTIVGGRNVEEYAVGIFNSGAQATIAHNPSILGTPPPEDDFEQPQEAFGITNTGMALIGGNSIVGGSPEGEDTASGISNVIFEDFEAFGVTSIGSPVALIFDNDITGSVDSSFADGYGIAGYRDSTLLAARNRILGGVLADEGCCREFIGVRLIEALSTTLWFNTISGGDADDFAVGVQGEETRGPIRIEYNQILGGRAEESVTGIDLFDTLGTAIIRENTIEGGFAEEEEAEGVDLFRLRAIIDQNLIVGGTGEERCPGVELSTGLYDIRGNDITGCVTRVEGQNDEGMGIWVTEDESETASIVTIEGNTIDGGVADCVAGIYAHGSTTITDNVIYGGTGSDVAIGIGYGRMRCFDIDVDESTVLGTTVSGNVIQAGTSGFLTVGAWLQDGFHELTNNIIHGGEATPFGCCGTSASAGVVQERDAFVFAVNNTIYGGRSVHSQDEVFGSFGYWFLGPFTGLGFLPFPPPGSDDDEVGVATFLINNIIDPGVAEGGNHSAALFMQKEWYVFLSHNDLWGERMTHMLVSFPWAGGDPDRYPPDFLGVAHELNTCTWGACYFSSGNISEDPLFVAPGAGDFHVEEGSPVIDAATDPTPDGVPVPMDIDWDPRPFGLFDMGADEFVPELER